MASGPEKDKETPADDASSVKDAGASASGESTVAKPASEPDDPQTALTQPAEPEAAQSTADASGPDEADNVEQLGLPGMPAESKIEDPHDDEHHHEDYDQYHDEFHEEHYHDHGEYDEHHHGDHHEDYHYHDHHYDDPQHSAYRRAAAATAAASGPLDQRNIPDYEPELDDEGNPYGGPVKPFLDHLEDLRWVILKCVIALLISMLGCMMGAKHLVGVLMYPLKQAEQLGLSKRTDIPLMIGQRTVGRLDFTTFDSLNVDTNAAVFKNKNSRFQLVPVESGTNMVLALQPFIPKQSKGIATSFDEIMVDVKNYGPLEVIWLCLQLALYGGLVIGAPFIIFFIAEFVLPALKVSEKKFLYKVAGVCSLLFMLGVAFCYFLIVQVALKASVEFSHWLGFGADEWRASDYLSFVVKFLLVMGAAFELPVVLLTIVKIGLLNYKQLSEFRHYFIVGMLVVSAVITPSGDPFTMVLVAVPLWILYEICVIIARVWYRQEQAEEAKLAAGG